MKKKYRYFLWETNFMGTYVYITSLDCKLEKVIWCDNAYIPEQDFKPVLHNHKPMCDMDNAREITKEEAFLIAL